MATRKTKEPSGAVTPNDSQKLLNAQEQSNTKTSKKSTASEKQDALKGRHFVFIVYKDSAPENWIELLKQTGLRFVVSPYHDKDINPDNTPKKPHWHVIVSWGNTTTFRAAKRLCETLNCPLPQMVQEVTGMYKYLTHKDNPDKYEYWRDGLEPVAYNGWERPLDAAAVNELMAEIRLMVYLYDCTEYGELVSECMRRGSEYFNVVNSHTIFFDRLCAGYRHNPVRVLRRVLREFDDDSAEQAEIERLIRIYQEGDSSGTPPVPGGRRYV